MSIQVVREALQEAGIPGAVTMRYGVGEVQIYSVNGVDIERPAGEMVSMSVVELIKALKAP